MPTIGIVGGGNVGANTAFFLAERDVADVILYDAKEGFSEGKALDMMEASTIRTYQVAVSGTSSIEDIVDTDVVIIAGSTERTSGMQRDDLIDANQPLVDEVAAKLTNYQGSVIIVCEPVDLLTTVFVRKSGLPPAKVMGLGGCLDAVRLRFLIARELSMSFESVRATVIGRHSDEMIPLPEYCRVSGVPVSALMSREKIDSIFEETKNAGDHIVELAQRSGAFYGPAATASDLAEAIIRGTGRIISVSQMFQGQYGIEGAAMSLPSIIGKNGIEKTLEPVLADEQKAALAASAEAIKSALGQ